ncbi:MAG: PRD domain-containing protein, partial [Erysipelotrichaceae bacterium]|nr:PRD domain-containing protein [Erysipelotrichaceae bacterium]
DEDMYNLVRTKYRREFEGAMDILKLIREKYGYVATEMDALYLTIHIARVINE